ncbi:MAG: hypothetical protein WC901_02510 [Candidatus Margulisiibacteriota bacterium]
MPSRKIMHSLGKARRRVGIVSQAATGIYSTLGYVNRRSISISLREQTAKFLPGQRTQLALLLVQHQILQPTAAPIELTKIGEADCCRAITRRDIDSFLMAFNAEFSGVFEGYFRREQFSFLSCAERAGAGEERTLVAIAEVAPVAGSIDLRAEVLEVLRTVNRPITVAGICEEINDIHAQRKAGKVGDAEIGVCIGQLLPAGTLSSTVGPRGRDKRFFITARTAELLAENTIFRYEDTRLTSFVFRGDIEALAKLGNIYRLLGRDGENVFLSEDKFRSQRVNLAEVFSGAGQTMAVYREDARDLAEKGYLIEGRHNDGLTFCYVDAAAQYEHRGLIFNAFFFDYLIVSPEMDAAGQGHCRARLARAFEVGLAAELAEDEETTVNEYLYEAWTVIRNGAKEKAVVMALVKRAEVATDLLHENLFTTIEIRDYRVGLERLALRMAFPMCYMCNVSWSLQNFFHDVYDQTDNYEVFLLLLVRKANVVRRLAFLESTPDSLNVCREMELVYAPLARSKGLIYLANNMLDCVAKLKDQTGYSSAKAAMEAEIGMEFDQARQHARLVARRIHSEVPLQLRSMVKILATRVKEVSAFVGKVSALGEEDYLDLNGVRFEAKAPELVVSDVPLTAEKKLAANIAVADKLAAELVRRFDLVPEDELPEGTAPIVNYLNTPNERSWNGWRGYFYDPLQPEGNERRIFSVQIFTPEMTLADRHGEAAHWIYKTKRAAKADHQARMTKRKFMQPLFDSVSPNAYNGDPEHDYYVDQRIARQHKRVLVWLPDQPFSAKDFAFPESGELLMLRMGQEETVEDAAAFRSWRSMFGSTYGYTEVYTFGLREDGKIGIRPWQGAARAAVGAISPNGSLLVFMGGVLDDKAYQRLHSKVKTVRARLFVERKLKHADPEQLALAGVKQSAGQLIYTNADLMQVLRATELLDESEIYQAIALGILTEDEIRKITGALGITITVQSLPQEKTEITVTAPDKIGLLSQILGQLSPDLQVLAASSGADKQARGASPSTSVLTVRPRPGIGMPQINKNKLSQSLEAFGRVKNGGGENLTQLKAILIPSAGIKMPRHWSMLREMLGIAQAFQLNILELTLPDLLEEKGKKTGEVLFEWSGDHPFLADDLAEISSALAGIMPETVNFMIAEVA